ncbi:predicted protein [Naegleria gruberi]|uniref:Predicted protein n=1 Tax=Naegleria gruberi TaxID=5762 RepID=D2VAK0_NAEGR|nr:uncharacterized protein NAEGRDRAFT_65884 [Naegleria gruberi]EFC45968.1 predicted protein [Naegleria gruberi]|eukprot:XP_002678712.1 predicted protein [Naegleria gruberi strain NEG-M]
MRSSISYVVLLAMMVLLIVIATTASFTNASHEAVVLEQINQLEDVDISESMAATLGAKNPASVKITKPKTAQKCSSICREACRETYRGGKKSKCLDHCPSVCSGI